MQQCKRQRAAVRQRQRNVTDRAKILESRRNFKAESGNKEVKSAKKKDECLTLIKLKNNEHFKFNIFC